jgi:hypothetical protein
MKQATSRVTAAPSTLGAVGTPPPPQLARLSVTDPQRAILLNMPKAERTHALQAVLDGPAGHEVRGELTRWIVRALSVERLVPQAYAEWRPVVHEAMLFFGSHLSTPRYRRRW